MKVPDLAEGCPLLVSDGPASQGQRSGVRAPGDASDGPFPWHQFFGWTLGCHVPDVTTLFASGNGKSVVLRGIGQGFNSLTASLDREVEAAGFVAPQSDAPVLVPGGDNFIRQGDQRFDVI